MRLCIVSLALVTLLLPQEKGRFRVHTYLIPAKMEQRWITIEYDNPNCPRLSENDSGRELVIPETGFLCTSSQREAGRHREEYYVVDDHQRRTALKTEQWIQRRESFTTRTISSATGSAASLCDVSGDEFFYGPKEKLTYENPIMKDEGFLKLHPGCRSPSRH